MRDETLTAAFADLVRDVEPRLRVALCAALGVEVGREGTADALGYGWENWGRLAAMDNPAGYLYRVGRSRARRYRNQRPVFPPVPEDRMPWVEPGLPAAVARLSERQRVAVVLLHGLDWTYQEVGDFLGLTVTTGTCSPEEPGTPQPVSGVFVDGNRVAVPPQSP